jgi:hypothetical protein
MWYGFEGSASQALVPVPVERVTEVLELNRRGKLPEELIEIFQGGNAERLEYTDGAGEGSLTRFEKNRPKKKKKKRRGPRSHPNNS